MGVNWLSLFSSLLPRNSKWALTEDKDLTKFFKAIGTVLDTSTSYLTSLYDQSQAGMTLSTLKRKEIMYNIPGTDLLSEAQRRSNLAATEADIMPLGAASIQNYLQALGFNVWVHEWWNYAAPPEPLDLEEYFPPIGAGTLIRSGRMNITPHYTSMCGENFMITGENTAVCNGFDRLDAVTEVAGIMTCRVEHPQVPGKYYWPYVTIIGGETFPNFASVPEERKQEFIEIVRRRLPANQWAGMLVTFE